MGKKDVEKAIARKRLTYKEQCKKKSEKTMSDTRV